MTAAAVATTSFDLGRIAEAFAPGRFTLDPFGLVSGYKAYLIYTGLATKSEEEIAAMGLKRQDLPRIAMTAAKALRRT